MHNRGERGASAPRGAVGLARSRGHAAAHQSLSWSKRSSCARVTPNEREELQKAIALSLAVPARRASRPADSLTRASADALGAERAYRVGEQVEVRYDGGAHYYDAIITGETPQASKSSTKTATAR